MKQVDVLYSGGIVVTMDSDFTIFYDGAVAVSGTDIVDVGKRETLAAKYEATETIDCAGQYILPGLVNAHTHVPMTLLRGLAMIFGLMCG